MTRAGVRTCSVAGVAVVLLVMLARPAAAHPSDFDTLTLDLLLGADGLVATEAAVVPTSDGYEPFATPALKREIAVGVLQALDIATSDAEVEADSSPRYHEVGFQASFDDDVFQGQTASWAIPTRPLQDLARNHGMERLKIGVCGVTEEGERSDRQVLEGLDIRADASGREPTGQERPACRIWVLHHQDPATSVVIGPRQLAETGVAISHAGWLAVVLLLLGWEMRDLARRTAS